MSFFEWLGRVFMLVLAGMITLSIIGAIAAIPNGIVPQQLGLERRQAPVPDPAAPEQQSEDTRPEAQPGNSVEGSTETGVGQGVVVPAEPEPVDPAQWLEAITYALLALAGLAALGCLLLWRGVLQQRRIADALEALSAAPHASSARPS